MPRYLEAAPKKPQGLANPSRSNLVLLHFPLECTLKQKSSQHTSFTQNPVKAWVDGKYAIIEHFVEKLGHSSTERLDIKSSVSLIQRGI